MTICGNQITLRPCFAGFLTYCIFNCFNASFKTSTWLFCGESVVTAVIESLVFFASISLCYFVLGVNRRVDTAGDILSVDGTGSKAFL